jgi:hypothetical protein
LKLKFSVVVVQCHHVFYFNNASGVGSNEFSLDYKLTGTPLFKWCGLRIARFYPQYLSKDMRRRTWNVTLDGCDQISRAWIKIMVN